MSGRKRREQVTHPPHYKRNNIEAITVIEAFELGFNLGNVVKYVLRAGHKTRARITDLEKAEWYIRRELDMLHKRELARALKSHAAGPSSDSPQAA